MRIQLGTISAEKFADTDIRQDFVKTRAGRLNVNLDTCKVVAEAADGIVQIFAESEDREIPIETRAAK